MTQIHEYYNIYLPIMIFEQMLKSEKFIAYTIKQIFKLLQHPSDKNKVNLPC